MGWRKEKNNEFVSSSTHQFFNSKNHEGDLTINNHHGLTNGNCIAIGSSLIDGNGLTCGKKFSKSNELSNSDELSDRKLLSDGSGLTDGNGLTNGNGLTIGQFYTNNEIQSNKQRRIKKIKDRGRRKRLLGILAAIILVLTPLNIYFWEINEDEINHIWIDGDFEDWENIPKNVDDFQDQESNVNVNIMKYQVSEDGLHYYFYLEVYGTIFNGVEKIVNNEQVSGFDTVHIFLDTDCQSNTGYHIENMGADYSLEIQGFNNMIYNSYLKKYVDSQYNNNWNGWSKIKSDMKTSVQNKRLESRIALDSFQSQNANTLALFHVMDAEFNEDFSEEILSIGNEILRVNQKRTSYNILRSGSKDNKLTEFIFQSDMDIDSILIDSITLTRLGNALDSDTDNIDLIINNRPKSSGRFQNGKATFVFEEPLIINHDKTISLDVGVDISKNAVSSRVIGVTLDSINDISTEVQIPIIIESDFDLKYIDEISSGIVIDGAFSDWNKIPINYDEDEYDITNDDVDLTSYQIDVNSNELSFCFEVEGKILNGVAAPKKSEYIIFNEVMADDVSLSSTLPSNTNLPTLDIKDMDQKLVGKDTAHVFIDVDDDHTSGYYIPVIEMGADFLVEITGKNGVIIENTLLEYKGQSQFDWSWEALENVDVGLGVNKLETQIKFDQICIDPDDQWCVYYQIFDWQVDKNKDHSEQIVSDNINGLKDQEDLTHDNDNNNNYNHEVHEIDQVIDNIEYDQTDNIESLTRGKANALKQITNGTGARTDDCFGWNVSTGGDINDDGYSDVIIGAPFNDTGGSNAGAAYIFFGYPSINLNNIDARSANVTLFGEDANDHFGWDVHYAGDLDDDNYDDVIVGAPDTQNGTAYIFTGAGIQYEDQYGDGIINAKSESNVTISGVDAGDRFGFSVSSAGDVNSDGFDDVIIGTPRNRSFTGSAYIFLGNKSMSSKINGSDLNITMNGSKPGDRFGSSVSTAGDVNSDNFDDVIIGSPGFDSNKGRAYLYYGSENMTGWTTDIKFAHWDESDDPDYNPPGYGIHKSQFLAQSFTPNDNFKLTKVSLFIEENGGTPGNLIISLQGDNNGPDDNILAVAPIRSSGPTSFAWVEFEFTDPYVLSSGDKYWIVASGTGNNALNCWVWMQDEDTGTDFIGGRSAFNGGAGKPWTVEPATSDYWLKFYGQLPASIEKNVTLSGGSSGDLFGFSVSGAGDVGKDGYDDVIIGAPGTTNGSAYFVNGSSKMEDIAVIGNGWGDEELVTNWESGGDLELVIYDDTTGNEQRLAQSFIPDEDYNLTKISVYIETTGTPGTLTLKLMGSTGTYPNTVPDDNVLSQAPSISTGNKSYQWEEFVLTTPYLCKAATEYFIVLEGTGADTGNCWVWYVQSNGAYTFGDYAFNQGSSWTPGTRDCYFRAYGKPRTVQPNNTFEGNPGDRFGWSVSAGDVNNDGYTDVIIGAPYNDTDDGKTMDAGASYVFYGNSIFNNNTASNADNITYGQNSYDHFGWSICFASKVNSDKYYDVIIGAPHFDNGTNSDVGIGYIMSYDVEVVIPEYHTIFLPLFLLIIIIAVFRKKQKFKKEQREVV